jgi:ferredoxin-NADP reductase
MYRLVLFVLEAIAIVSIVLAAIGQLSYGWLELLASLVVAVVSSVVTTQLIALPFRVKPQLDSAVITGLLLFFILLPSIEVRQLLVIALAATIASASKFLLAWRGRHILNPAAAGALAVTATGLTVSGWWVATPALFPVVLLGAAIVLYRTRRVTLGLVFVLVAAAIEIARFSGTSGLVDAASLVFLSLPLVFFAGFMLSEPLTLPPLRWQQVVVAALVAVLFAVPFSIGPVFASPQLALVIGNIVAFAFGQRRGIRLVLEESRRLSPTTVEFTFRPLRPVRFQPGQYVELDLPHGGADLRGRRRVFSISSAPASGDQFTIAMTIGEPASSFKRALLALEPGSRVVATSVAGDFLLPAGDVPLLLVAGGIGVTPFASQLASRRHPDTTLVYATSSPELPYADVIEASGARVVLLAPEPPAELPLGWVYAGSGRITRDVLAAHVPDAGRRRAFVSGPPALVSDTRRMLRSLGSRRVTTDYFTGY